MKNRKTIIAILLTVLCMAMIWPVGLVRRETDSYSGNHDYVNTDLLDTGLEQVFLARDRYLYQLGFVLDYPAEASGKVRFCLKNEAGKVIVEKELALAQMDPMKYNHVEIGKLLKKGARYTYSIAPAEPETAVEGVYTGTDGNHNQDNILLTVNDTPYPGQAVTHYVWGEGLNWKNVLCIWACIITIAVAFHQAAGKWFLNREKG